MKQLNNVVRLALILLLSVGSTALKEKDSNNTESLSKQIARQLTAIASVAPSGNPFTEVASLTGINWGDMAWGDYDNDGDYDVVVTGNSGTSSADATFAKLYKNTGGVFTEDTNNPLMQFDYSSCDWGDYDGDGDVDLLITGYSSTTVLAAGTAIYNNNNGILTMITTPDISGAGYSTCSWVDVDSDGDLDATVMGLFITPPNSGGDLGTLLRNDGNNVFTRSFNFLGADQGDAVWADYDNDKDMDVLVTGGFNNTTININNVTSNFSIASLDGLSFSGAVWGDFDADGDPDLIVTGQKYNTITGIINLYKNDGSGNLTSVGTAGITAHYEASITAGDYDNDGDLDILLTGFTANTSSMNADLYKNDGTGNFTQVSNPGFYPVRAGEAKWADYDNDGDLDLILSGGTDSNLDGVVKIYRNDLNPANTKPNTPTGLALIQSGTTLNFSWNTTSDAEGGKVTYNLRVGTTPGGSEIMSPSSNSATGYHRIAKPGNVQGTTSWKIQNSTASKIYWSVQAIDNSLLGGNFATEVSITHQLPITGFVASPANQKVNLSWTNPNASSFATIYRETTQTTTPSNIIASSQSGSTYTDNTAVNGTPYYYYILSTDNNGSQSTLVSVSALPGIFTDVQSLAGITGVQGRNMWGDYDHDGDYDIFVSGDAGAAIDVTSNEITKIYNNSNGTFTEATNITLAAVPYGWASWNDYDNDNDLDVLITSSYGQYSSNLYQNTNGAFNDVTDLTKLQPAGGYHGWADWDNDGDMDLAVAQDNASLTARNDRAAGFSPAFQLEGGNNLKWADYDNDGDQDFVMFGQAEAYIVFNNNKGALTKIESSSLNVSFGFDCAWIDVDNDGKLDLIGSGNYSDGYLKVYMNTGSGFSVFSNVGSAGLMFTSLAVGDYDNDGDADIALTGISYVTFNSFTKLLSNDGSGHYTEVANTILPNVSQSTLAWCDYDHDGDLDLLLSGEGDDNAIITKVFRNNLNVSNAPPSVPAGLQASVGNASATFNWNSSTDTQGGAITYNLRVGTTPNGSEILSPMADVNTGMLLTPGMGNVQLNRSWSLNLPNGTYYWSVQSVDGAYAASNFAAEQQLVVDYPTTTGIVDQTLTYGDAKSIDLSSSFASTSVISYSVAITNNTTASATLQGSSLNIATLNAGAATVTVTATVASGGTSTASFTITVNKAALQITADDKTMVYHDAFPAYTYKMTGLKLTDTESVISSSPILTGPDVNADAGTYPITVTVGTAANYDIATVNGILTINKAAGQVTLGALAQDFVNFPRAVTVTVIPTGLEVDVTYSGSSIAPTAIGSYDVVATINDINYQGSATGTLVISAVTAVEDLSKRISVYPNPIKDELYVDVSGLEKARVSIVDMLGQEVRSQNLENAVTMVDCRTLSNGMFLVIVYDASNRKVMIAKAVKI